VQPGQRSGKTGDGIGDDRMAQLRITLAVLIGIDQQLADLRRQPFDHPGRQRTAMQFLQPLVHAPHAPAEAAGKDDAGDLLPIHQ